MIVTKANQALLKQFYGDVPRETMRAIVAVEKGKPIALVGVKIEKSRGVMFSEFTPECRNHPGFKRLLVKGIPDLFEIIPRYLPVYASADPAIEGAETLLKHVGFHHCEGDVWRR